MSIENNTQFYDAIGRTAARLEELGLKGDADNLRGALSYSSIASELLGYTRHVLREIVAGAALPEDVETAIASEIAYVDTIWKTPRTTM